MAIGTQKVRHATCTVFCLTKGRRVNHEHLHAGARGASMPASWVCLPVLIILGSIRFKLDVEQLLMRQPVSVGPVRYWGLVLEFDGWQGYLGVFWAIILHNAGSSRSAILISGGGNIVPLNTLHPDQPHLFPTTTAVACPTILGIWQCRSGEWSCGGICAT